MNITSWLQYDFMRNAIIAVLIITPLFGIMGTMIVNKKMQEKFELNVKADVFCKKEAPLLYCFRFPIGEYYHLPKGKYRISKSFLLKEKDEINLYAEFEIK